MRESLAPAPGRFPDADALGSRMRLSAGYVAANPRIFGEQPPADALPAVLAALYLLMGWNAHAPGAREGVDAYLARQLSPRQIDDMANWRQRLSRECGINDPPAFDALLPQLAQALSDDFSLTPEQTTGLQAQLQSCFDDTGPYSPPPPPPPVIPEPPPKPSFLGFLGRITDKILHPLLDKHPIAYSLLAAVVFNLLYYLFITPPLLLFLYILLQGWK